MNFKGRAKRIDDIDLPRIGAKVGVGEDEIHALIDVEAAGSGFDAQGRPKMLFEPHVFYRNLTGKKRAQAVSQGLAHPKWKRNYPKDSYPRLHQAMKINATAALKSASWGFGQVLGENYHAAGYGSPKAMVTALMDDEENHLEAMVSFIKYNGLDKALRDHDWKVFAYGYNGPGYARNKYHIKLAAAYAKWAKIPDTPYSPETPPTTPKQDAIAPRVSKPLAGAIVGGTALVVGFWDKIADFIERTFAWIF